MLTSDMRAVLESARLGFVATVTPEGRPNLSPKGTIRAWDDDHLFFLDIASPGTRANIAHTPWMEVNVVDQLSRRGYRFSGMATSHFPASEIYEAALQRAYGDAPRIYPTTAVVLLAIEHAAPLLSPAYWAGADEAGLRVTWKDRRATLDREFDAYLAVAGTVGPQGELPPSDGKRDR
jgi:uncharacterized protein